MAEAQPELTPYQQLEEKAQEIFWQNDAIPRLYVWPPIRMREAVFSAVVETIQTPDEGLLYLGSVIRDRPTGLDYSRTEVPTLDDEPYLPGTPNLPGMLDDEVFEGRERTWLNLLRFLVGNALYKDFFYTHYDIVTESGRRSGDPEYTDDEGTT